MILILLVGSLLLNVILALMLVQRSKDEDWYCERLASMGKVLSNMYCGCKKCGNLVATKDAVTYEDGTWICITCCLKSKNLEPLHHQGRVEMPGLTHANTASPPE